MSLRDRMNEFVPGIVDDQQEFYHVAPGGAVTHWWLVPGKPGCPAIYGAVESHPLGDAPRPGWYDASGHPFPCDPREAAQ